MYFVDIFSLFSLHQHNLSLQECQFLILIFNEFLLAGVLPSLFDIFIDLPLDIRNLSLKVLYLQVEIVDEFEKSEILFLHHYKFVNKFLGVFYFFSRHHLVDDRLKVFAPLKIKAFKHEILPPGADPQDRRQLVLNRSILRRIILIPLAPIALTVGLQNILNIILFNQVLNTFDLLIELQLFLFTLLYQGSQFLLYLIPLLVSSIGHLYDLPHLSTFLKQLLF